MNNERNFLKCAHCGNVVEMLKDQGTKIMCCGQIMSPLIANTVDAAAEKHIPAVSRNENVLTVTVGSVPHPMTDEHHIAFIVVAQGDKTLRAALSPTGSPTAVFLIDDGPATVYEYCNLHGLWAAEITV